MYHERKFSDFKELFLTTKNPILNPYSPSASSMSKSFQLILFSHLMKAPWFLIEKIIFFCDLGPLIFLIFIGLTDIFFQCRYFSQTCSINVSGKNISWLRSPINGGKFLENFLTPWGSPVGGTIRRQVHQKYHFFVYPFFFNGRVLVLMCLDVWCPKTI